MATTVREILLKLSPGEIRERKKATADYYFYKGTCEDKELAKNNKELLGQNWVNNDNVDYEPTQDVRNRVKPLLRKQARWMFGKEPDVILNPINKNDKESCEDLRQFIDKLLEQQHFWKNTRKAFLMSTIKKRVLLRVAASENRFKIRYDDIDNFSYEEIDDNLVRVRFFQSDLNNAFVEEDSDKIYYIHIYSYTKFEDDKPLLASYTLEKYKGDDLENPISSKTEKIGFDNNKLPVWLIKNGGELGDEFGESDLQDLIEPQNNYNKKTSDYADALRFQMFGAESVIDGEETTVNSLTIAPNALHAIKTRQEALDQGKQAVLNRVEYNMGNSQAINDYLESCKEDMNFILDMPSLRELNNIPSAKAMRYLYNDLVARCEEKWNDWEPVLRDLLQYIISIATECKLPGFKKEWGNLQYTISFNHNYPIPSDEEEKKKLAMDEVAADVRSRKSYIKEYSKAEDYEEEFEDILKEKSIIEGISLGEFSGTLADKDDIEGNKQRDDDVDE
ncbi:Uncharacterised protein [uncultured Clostridium sp.]|uniref:phage portal protein n=1 Tax=uncultured Clostridium sp. TaxID=59620 RepID=UPI00082307E0|nr:phage portal protein [uncultured Clostridium sp.]SCJ52458.1 Uncharacterised protein [uncultured Clostridium sp.]